MIVATELIAQANAAVAPQALTSETLTPEQVAMRRKFCDWLALWRHCVDPACRRAHRCARDPTPCFAQFWTICPESTRVWVVAGMCAVEGGHSMRAATHEADVSMLGYVRVQGRLPPFRGFWRDPPMK
jgi:hypothetical protein